MRKITFLLILAMVISIPQLSAQRERRAQDDRSSTRSTQKVEQTTKNKSTRKEKVTPEKKEGTVQPKKQQEVKRPTNQAPTRNNSSINRNNSSTNRPNNSYNRPAPPNSRNNPSYNRPAPPNNRNTSSYNRTYQYNYNNSRNSGNYYGPRHPSFVRTQHIGGRDVNVYVNVHNYYHRVNVLPKRAKMVHYHGHPYYYRSGIFYRPIGNTYIISRPPIGALIAASIINTTMMAITLNEIYQGNVLVQPAQTYYYDDGTFYNKKGRKYEVIQPPIGVIVPVLPSGFEEFILEGETFYKVEETLYKPVPDGFEVVGKTVVG